MKHFVLLIFISNFLFAIDLVPLTQTVKSKRDKNILFQVSNTTSDPVAVDFSLLKVVGIKNNKEQRVDTSEVQAYPTQFILNPKETKSVRVRYMNKKLPQYEEIYRVMVKELDIDVSDKSENRNITTVHAQLKVRYSYEGLIFVHQENATANIFVESIKRTMNGIELTLKNSGNMSAIPYPNIYNYIAILAGGKEQTLLKKDLKGVDLRRVLTGKNRTFFLKNITSLPIAKIESMKIIKK